MRISKLLCIFLLLSSFSFAQTCLPDGIDFTTQEQIDSFTILYPDCIEIQGDVEFDGGSNITNLNGLNNIVKIDGNLEIYDNTVLTSLAGLEQLELVTGDLDIIANGLINLNGLNNLNRVDGFVWIDSNPALQSLDGLNSLTSVGDFMEILDNLVLTSLEGLENLEVIVNDGFQLDYNPQLTNLDGLEKLRSTGGRFVIEDHPLLENVDALINLRHIGNTLRIQSNPNLPNILGLDGLVSVTDNVRIFNNSQLEDCSVNILCNNWAIGGAIDIFNNAVGCSDTLEVLSKCQEGISGTAYFDFNQNAQRDSFEGGIPMLEINVDPNILSTFSNQNGKYFFTADEGVEYTFQPANYPDWTLITSPDAYSINYINGSTSNQNNDFGFSPNFSNHSFFIDQFSNATRCNSEVDFFIDAKNTGTFLEENGKIEIQFDELYSYVNAIPAPQNIDIASRILSWDLAELYPFQHQQIQITFSMPDETFTGVNTTLTTTVSRDSLGQLIEAANNNYQSIIRCSYDPNDKLVFPTGEQSEGFIPKDTPLEYTIRFQNTGNDYAWDIEIQDTLDMDLDWSSFRLIQSSHEMQTTLRTDGSISFLFENIYLPDSTTDFAGSQGFIRYNIQPKPDLPDYTIIENTAFIYFDFNPPIVTNTTINTLVDEIPVSTQDLEENENARFKLWPNPGSTFINIELEQTSISEEYFMEILDLIGQSWSSNRINNFKQLSVANLPKGIYLVTLRSARTNEIVQTQRLLLF